MVGLRINVKNQKQFDFLRILTLALSIVLEEDGIEAVKNYFNMIFDEYYMEISSSKIENKNSLAVTVLNLGGVITGIYIPDKDGKIENIVAL